MPNYRLAMTAILASLLFVSAPNYQCHSSMASGETTTKNKGDEHEKTKAY